MVTLVLRDDSYVDVTLERVDPLFWFHYKHSRHSMTHLGGGGGSAITGTITLTGTSTTSGTWTTGNLTITKFF